MRPHRDSRKALQEYSTVSIWSLSAFHLSVRLIAACFVLVSIRTHSQCPNAIHMLARQYSVCNEGDTKKVIPNSPYVTRAVRWNSEFQRLHCKFTMLRNSPFLTASDILSQWAAVMFYMYVDSGWCAVGSALQRNTFNSKVRTMRRTSSTHRRYVLALKYCHLNR